jgi:hypothetical protein
MSFHVSQSPAIDRILLRKAGARGGVEVLHSLRGDGIDEMRAQDIGASTTRHDHVDVWMMGHRGAPGVEHRGEADLDAQALGIGRNRAHCLRGKP